LPRYAGPPLRTSAQKWLVVHPSPKKNLPQGDEMQRACTVFLANKGGTLPIRVKGGKGKPTRQPASYLKRSSRTGPSSSPTHPASLPKKAGYGPHPSAQRGGPHGGSPEPKKTPPMEAKKPDAMFAPSISPRKASPKQDSSMYETSGR
jgi:hypothetical protein